MALIVETGQAGVDSESYISVAAATAYHVARGNTAWAAVATDTLREQYLRRATDYMQQEYGERWAGYRVSTTQALAWPRYGVPIKDYSSSAYPLGSYWPSNSVPTIVANACAELALRAISGSLSPDLERAVRREKVGPIETEYEPGSLQSTRFDAVDNMLAPLMKRLGLFLPVERV